jgi:transaldolase
MTEAVTRRGTDASDGHRGDVGTDQEPAPVSPHDPVPAVELVGISKIFGSTVAAKHVSFELFPGEVLALVGENGAGKSTLVKTVGGVYRPDEGYLRVAGERVELHSPLDAQHRQAALTDGASYQQQIADLAARGANVDDTVREITTDDVRHASDLFSGVYSRTGGVDGRVSIEVDPRLAHDTTGTIAHAQELFKIVDRANVLIKIPATLAGLPAITAVTAEGISVNVTLIFSLDRYEAVMDAYLTGLEQAQSNGHSLSDIHSVASFFVSRVDLEIDKRLHAIGTPQARELLGRAAIANARLAYQAYQDTFTGDRWDALAAAGANKQRPLWASTGVKNPAYDDTRYVVELVAPGTVNTAPENTINAVADHGVIRGNTIEGTYGQATAVFSSLEALGIDLTGVFEVLETEGVQKFEQAWEELLTSVRQELTTHPATD